jgi:hypothetical protein
MIPRTTMELVPAPAMTPGMVNTPVPMMLPITKAVAEGSPSALARDSAREGGAAWSCGLIWGGVMATGITCLVVGRNGCDS